MHSPSRSRMTRHAATTAAVAATTRLTSLLLVGVLAMLLGGRPVFAAAQAEETATNVIDHRSPTERPLPLRDDVAVVPSSTTDAAAVGQVNDPTTTTTTTAASRSQNVTDVDRLVEQMMLKSASSSSSDDGHSEAEAADKPLAGDFGITLGDLEDLAAERDDATELTLAEEKVVPVTTMIPAQDSRNIYKVGRAKGVSAPLRSAVPVAVASKANHTDDGFGGFDIYKTLFDHSVWTTAVLASEVSAECARDVRIFMEDLAVETPWALQASDQSGRYRGMYFFGNEFWVGNELFCREINLQRRLRGAAAQARQPELEFFVANFVVAIAQRTVYDKPTTHLQVGQCLPVTCTIGDVGQILVRDPAAIELNSRPHSNITLQLVRTVPGAYALMADGRFQLLLSIIVVCFLCMCIATVCEIRAKRAPRADKTTKPSTTTTTTAAAAVKEVVNNYANGYSYSISGSGVTNNHNNNNNNNNNTNGQLKGHTNKAFHDGQLELHQIQPSDNHNATTTANGADGGHDAKRVATPVNKSTTLSENVQLGVFTRVVFSFGLLSNARAILTAKKLPDESVSCIHGMRVISMMWTIMVHTYLQTFGISENKFGRVIKERTFAYQIIGNANYAVDTFFFLSGLLVTLLYLRSEEAYKKKFSARPTLLADSKKTVLLFVYRYVRLTPVYFVALLCSEVSLKWVYNRSVFQPGLDDHAVCPANWWRNMLYIQNWFPFQQLCMIWSWYLANDMQFYVWAVLLLLLSTRFFKSSAVVMVAFLLSSWVISATISLKLNYTLELAEPLISFGFLYDMPWTRIGPYIMGMFAGYLIFRFKQPPHVPRAFNLIMWLVSLTITSLIVFGVWRGVLTVTETAFYVSLSHTGWGFALIWITLSCRWGYAPAVNKFLSYPAFLPLSRLTYCTYLIHPVGQILTAFQMQGPLHLQHVMVLTIFLGSAVVSYALAFALCVLCEAPMVRILRIFFKK